MKVLIADSLSPEVVDALVDLPFALPTAVAGIALTGLYATNGWIGQFFYDTFGWKIAYTPVGITIALTFIGLPFVVRTVQPVLEDLEAELGTPAIVLLDDMVAELDRRRRGLLWEFLQSMRAQVFISGTEMTADLEALCAAVPETQVWRVEAGSVVATA